ncbi:MAG: DnaD domain protein [Tissierellia bacterium]|nr:DnaD domain protein [Tissierellia bacterium]
MNYKLQELQMDFQDTAIENIFLNDFMPQADGNFVKVYLCGYQLAQQKASSDHYNHDFIAKRLGLLPSDVLRAWDYWEAQGIIKKNWQGEDYQVEFLNLKELYTRQVYSRPQDNSLGGFISSLDNPALARLFERVDYYMRREVPYQKKLDIASWTQAYNMSPSMIEEAFRYGTEVKGKRKLAYIEGIVRNWSEAGLHQLEDLEKSRQVQDQAYYRYRHILKLMGLGHKDFVEEEMRRINGYLDQAGFSMAMVEEAARRTALATNPNINYMESILKNWKAKGIERIEDLDRDTKPTGPKPGPARVSGDSRSLSYTEKQLEDMAKRKWASFQEKHRGGGSR